MPDIEPRMRLAEERVQELAIAIYEPPLSGARERPTYPDLDDPLDVAVLLIDADTEIEMQRVPGFLANSTGDHLRPTIKALTRIGGPRSAAALASAAADDPVGDVFSLFNAHYAVDDAYERLLAWLSTRLDRLDQRVAALGYRWRSSAGMDREPCSICGGEGVVMVVDRAVGTELRWSRSFQCDVCGEAVDADEVGPLPEPYRAAAIARSGLWGARPDPKAVPAAVARALARAYGCGLVDALARARSADGLVVVGTRAEAKHAVEVLRTQGVSCAIVRVDGDGG